VFKCKRSCDRVFKIRPLSTTPQEQKNAGRVVNIQNNQFREQQGFSRLDILWALGIWSVILSLSPVVVFYVLMVN
jgi:hypothetical protein